MNGSAKEQLCKTLLEKPNNNNPAWFQELSLLYLSFFFFCVTHLFTVSTIVLHIHYNNLDLMTGVPAPPGAVPSLPVRQATPKWMEELQNTGEKGKEPQLHDN